VRRARFHLWRNDDRLGQGMLDRRLILGRLRHILLRGGIGRWCGIVGRCRGRRGSGGVSLPFEHALRAITPHSATVARSVFFIRVWIHPVYFSGGRKRKRGPRQPAPRRWRSRESGPNP
jgi:hypothetical protein